MQAKTARPGKTAKPRRKLTRDERRQIEAVIRQAKGDGKTHTVQDSIPFRNIFPDGLCRLEGGTFSKTIAFEDVNYRLAGPEDQRSIFESLCDFYNGYDPTIGVQMTLSSRYVEHGPEEDLFGIRPQGDDLDPIRKDAAGILRFQYERGSNGYVKTKYVTLTIEAENLAAARARFARIETDTLNRFKVMGAAAHVLDGKERLELLHGILHPEGGRFAFDWDWLAPSGLSVKDFIAPSSFHFGETRTFRIGEMYGAVSFLQITAPEIHDRILAEFMETEGSLINTLVTNIMTRKQELSVLQSIGMTRQQLNKMVQCEAGLIAVWNIAITLLVGGFLGFLLIFSLNGIGMNYLHWAYPMWFAFAYVIIILAVPRLITKVAIDLLRQKPLVERLRETG